MGISAKVSVIQPEGNLVVKVKQGTRVRHGAQGFKQDWCLRGSLRGWC